MAGVALTTTSLRPLMLPRPLARSSLRSTGNSRTIFYLCRVFSLLTLAFSSRSSGLAFSVPTLVPSVVDLVVRIEKSASYKEIKATIKAAAEGPYKGIVEYSEDQVLSIEFIGHTASSIFDAGAGIQLSSNFVKLISWYGNGWGGYSRRVCHHLVYAAAQDERAGL